MTEAEWRLDEIKQIFSEYRCGYRNRISTMMAIQDVLEAKCITSDKAVAYIDGEKVFEFKNVVISYK